MDAGVRALARQVRLERAIARPGDRYPVERPGRAEIVHAYATTPVARGEPERLVPGAPAAAVRPAQLVDRLGPPQAVAERRGELGIGRAHVADPNVRIGQSHRLRKEE